MATSRKTLSDYPDSSTVAASSSSSMDQINQVASKCPSSEKSVEGKIRLTVEEVSKLKSKSCSPLYMFGNLPWRIAAKTECSKRTNNTRFFSVYVDCNPESESTLWSCEATVEFRLLPQQDDVPEYARQFTNKFNYNSNNWGFPSFMEWNDLLNIEKGYVKNDSVIVEAHLVIHKASGVRMNRQLDFSQPNPLADTVVVIDGIRLYISRSYLSLYSPVFQALFYGEWRERDQEEIPMEDVILEEFVELLQVMYPSSKPITGDNVEFLLELGDKYEINMTMDRCEAYLMKSDDHLINKLLWADQYNLSRLQDVCIKSLKSKDDIKELRKCEEYKSLSDTTKAALFEKLMKLI